MFTAAAITTLFLFFRKNAIFSRLFSTIGFFIRRRGAARVVAGDEGVPGRARAARQRLRDVARRQRAARPGGEGAQRAGARLLRDVQVLRARADRLIRLQRARCVLLPRLEIHGSKVAKCYSHLPFATGLWVR